jgi:hypothetical protein
MYSDTSDDASTEEQTVASLQLSSNNSSRNDVKRTSEGLGTGGAPCCETELQAYKQSLSQKSLNTRS